MKTINLLSVLWISLLLNHQEVVAQSKKYVRVFYVIPTDAARTDRAGLVDNAVNTINSKWAEYCAEFNREAIVTLNSTHNANWFLTNPDGLHGNASEWYWLGNAWNEVKAATGMVDFDPNYKTIIFLEVDHSSAGSGAAAAANFGASILPEPMISSIENNNQADIGAIGHELGHNFGLAHEDCPTGPFGVMCNGSGDPNGGFPNVEVLDSQKDVMFSAEQLSFFVDPKYSYECETGTEFIANFDNQSNLTNNTHNISASNTAAFTSDARAGSGAISFNGNTHCIFGKSTEAKLVNDVSISLWVKAPNITSNTAIFGITEFSGNLSGTDSDTWIPGGFYVAVDNNDNLGFDVGWEGGAWTSTPTGIDDNTWHHLVVTWDYQSNGGTIIRLFLDKVEQVSATLNIKDPQYSSIVPVLSNHVLKLGYVHNRNDAPAKLNGNIDEVHVIPGVLTTQEIDDLYNLSSPGGCQNCIDFNAVTLASYSNQDADGTNNVLDNGSTLQLVNNTWKRTTQTFNITANTVVEFEFMSDNEGEIHGIGFDENNNLSSNRIFKVHGTQNWGITTYDNYSNVGNYVTYTIPVGNSYTGSSMYLILVNDNDGGSGNNSNFRNVRVYENSGARSGLLSQEEIIDEVDDEVGLSNQIKIYPNPLRKEIQVKLNPKHQFVFGRIFDLSGQMLMEKILESGQTSVSFDLDAINANPGIYLLKVGNEQTQFEYKLIKD